ncbi:MAG TPA: MotA/TolQ/ExbB proton channel family protein [Opitutaceae bacterium]|nr:MotA/TolQ/ExbB proton channel family protein [Opitutaceae bacterium]
MKELRELVERGGLPILAIMTLAVVLYSRTFRLFFALTLRWRRIRAQIGGPRSLRAQAARVDFQRLRLDLEEEFESERTSLTALIAAAPLLGLLGTVSGMTKTFETLGGPAAEKSMENLARGISEVLVATEAGLTVAIPGLVLVFLAHRILRRCSAMLIRLERETPGSS